ncbi:MAG: cupin domain-containing protein [Candidatus Nanopelagicales bacterium]|nr:cupin domain-containing protein [Candidatus Nanopelagicales bacterium]
MTNSSVRNDLGHVILATKADIDAMPWESRPEMPGVTHKVLWQAGDVVLGVMRVEHGAENPIHTHHGAHHHILILEGECTVLDKRVGPGSYIYIPPTVPHGATDVGPDGCTFFYTYRPLEHSPITGPLDSEHAHPV